MTLHWREDEGLYESDTIGVPVGEHNCQLAVGGDVVPTEMFEVNEDSDVIFIIIEEGTIFRSLVNIWIKSNLPTYLLTYLHTYRHKHILYLYSKPGVRNKIG